MHPNAERVQAELKARGAAGEVVQLATSTRTSQEAAAGTPNAVFWTTPDELIRLPGGEVVALAAEGR